MSCLANVVISSMLFVLCNLLCVSTPIRDTCINCFHMMILYFTQVNKVPVRSLGMCLGKDVVVPMGYMPTAPTFFAELQHAVTTAATHTILAL